MRQRSWKVRSATAAAAALLTMKDRAVGRPCVCTHTLRTYALETPFALWSPLGDLFGGQREREERVFGSEKKRWRTNL